MFYTKGGMKFTKKKGSVSGRRVSGRRVSGIKKKPQILNTIKEREINNHERTKRRNMRESHKGSLFRRLSFGQTRDELSKYTKMNISLMSSCKRYAAHLISIRTIFHLNCDDFYESLNTQVKDWIKQNSYDYNLYIDYFLLNFLLSLVGIIEDTKQLEYDYIKNNYTIDTMPPNRFVMFVLYTPKKHGYYGIFHVFCVIKCDLQYFVTSSWNASRDLTPTETKLWLKRHQKKKLPNETEITTVKEFPQTKVLTEQFFWDNFNNIIGDQNRKIKSSLLELFHFSKYGISETMKSLIGPLNYFCVSMPDVTEAGIEAGAEVGTEANTEEGIEEDN